MYFMILWFFSQPLKAFHLYSKSIIILVTYFYQLSFDNIIFVFTNYFQNIFTVFI